MINLEIQRFLNFFGFLEEKGKYCLYEFRRKIQGSSLFLTLQEHLFFPVRLDDGEMCALLDRTHPSGDLKASGENSKEFGIDLVDFVT